MATQGSEGLFRFVCWLLYVPENEGGGGFPYLPLLRRMSALLPQRFSCADSKRLTVRDGVHEVQGK